MSELSKPEEDLQDPGEAQGPIEVPLLEAEVGESASHLASYYPASSSAPMEALPQEILDRMIGKLMKFLLLKYRAKELTSQAEMLNKVLRDNQEHFPVVFREVSVCLQLVFGVDVKEVDPAEHIYILVPILGLTCDEMLSDGVGLPKAGFLVLVLSMIMRFGDPAPEEAVWGALRRMGVYVGSEQCVFGELRELLTQVWVREGYLRYQQVPDSHPVCYEFLWGPRAYVETSKWQVMAFMCRVNQRALRTFPFLSA
ncbi:melanoma-associated antigen 8-like [Cervus elaphus]|uniref:melanoma-associated antigen 8-like n=1 Tax=Cervus elaphus TaxID=9860 RepID=UPI001CC27961|nr:melanoma-associated antigen 8-like [Cervus elaphus]XP_043752575.1 melanoma-associated antigen 8-like [Cervus elaphus]